VNSSIDLYPDTSKLYLPINTLYKLIPTSLNLSFFCVAYSVISFVMTKHYHLMMEELKSWTSVIIIDA